MTTQQTFETLVDRVSVATDKLETAVTAVELGTGEITVLVERAEQAEAGAIAASEIANDAAVDAVAAKNIILNTPLLPEAPVDGKQYARSNAEWVEVVASGGGGGTEHTHSVATVTEAGFMSATDKTKLDGVQSGATVGADWDTNVANKPTIPTQGITSIQAGDNITIDNTNPLSPVISATSGGGGGGGGFPIDGQDAGSGWFYDGVLLTEYPFTNPNKALDMGLLEHKDAGVQKTLMEMINSGRSINSYLIKLPDCNLWASGIKLGTLTLRSGVGRITTSVVGSTTFPFLTFTDSVTGITYVWENGAKVFTRKYT